MFSGLVTGSSCRAESEPDQSITLCYAIRCTVLA